MDSCDESWNEREELDPALVKSANRNDLYIEIRGPNYMHEGHLARLLQINLATEFIPRFETSEFSPVHM